jgi:phospholipid/cholesterol/gamma-HCH transport system permease protein
MTGPLIDTAITPEGDSVFIFRGSLSYEQSSELWQTAVHLLETTHPQTLVLDFGNVTTIDSAGISFLRLLQRHCQGRHIPVRYRAVPDSAEYFLRYVQSAATPPTQSSTGSLASFVDFIGRAFVGKTGEYHDMIQFFGDILLATVRAIINFRRFRWKETLYYAQLAGSEAMPIVFLLSFLLGLVMAFQAAVQLRQFGANIFVADLLSLALTRELGPVFTAVILAGRSGSAFAAEIGTMKINEEIDALTVMGFDITNFVVIPKVFALGIVGPLLTLLANGSGIMGGVVVGVLGLDLTPASFIEETFRILSLSDVLTGLVKSEVFAVLIALIGCFRGLQADKGADSVGRQTTSAVVSGLFLIIMADAVFTVIFHVFKW